MKWKLRLAMLEDVPALEELIPLSVRGLQAPYYSVAQMEAACGAVFGVDRQLITDGTYFVVEAEGRIVGGGGWSKRKSLLGGDAARFAEHAMLNAATDPARVRAFFIHPDWARRGIGHYRRRFLADRTGGDAGWRASLPRLRLRRSRAV